MKTPGDPLLFQSPPQHEHDWLLPLMIMVSLGIHAFSFYLIQASSPNTASSIPSSARLSILNPDQPADQKILAWVESHDPGQMAQNFRPLDPPPALLEVPYQPGYAQNLPEIQPVPDTTGAANFPSIAEPGLVKISSALNKASDSPASQSRRSEVRFSDGLTLQPGRENDLHPPSIDGFLPEPTRFLILLRADGKLQNAFLQNSSGNESLDLYARQWLRENRYAVTAESDSLSGEVAFFWGREIFQATKQ